MERTQKYKKYFCARCFLPIESEDNVNIENQNFHRICSMCCICRTIPTSLKMFYGHVFCNDCFKTHVMTRFKGDSPRLHSNSWWLQWGPGATSQEKKHTDKEYENQSEDQPKRFVCARCLQPVDENDRVTIGDQSFHEQCGQCYFCHKVPSKNPKIYYGQVFCDECFHCHVLNRNKDNPSEFFKNCFEQWGNRHRSADVARAPRTFSKATRLRLKLENVRNRENVTAATPVTISLGDDSQSWDLSFENRTEVSIQESNEESAKQENLTVVAAEKIEKLTKYLHERVELQNYDKKWKFLENEPSIADSCFGWLDLHDKKTNRECPRCLWQCGPIYVKSEYIEKEV
ncbi:uncharacterized protein LOC120628223 isoform X3 [Pararge aegeria]|uniref:uncharacterized protein LOC120628223 isoform X3 n=1 Tax=Pararge aegeria TaxID=116150 RepID=UPI0019CFFFCE|nr:uncharacterized protein LOC120628223 isoform X3 [Pararge aegeria]